MFVIKYTRELPVNMNIHTFGFCPTSQKYVNLSLLLISLYLIIIRHYIIQYYAVFIVDSPYSYNTCTAVKLQSSATSPSSAHSPAPVSTYL